MTICRAAGCGTPTDGYLCSGCVVGLRIELTDVPDLLSELDITRSKQDQLGDPTARIHHKKNEQPLPYKDITEATWLLHHTLHAWATDYGSADDATTPSHARVLLANLHHIRLHDQAAALADEVTHAIHYARAKIDRPDDRRMFLGLCGAAVLKHTDDRSPQTATVTHCREEVYGVPWKPVAICRACGEHHVVTDRQQWLLDIAQDRLGTSTEIAGYLRTAGMKCSSAQIRGYVRRGWIQPATDTDPPLYRMRDVLTAIQDRYQHRNRRNAS